MAQPVSKQPKLGETKVYDATLPCTEEAQGHLPVSWTTTQRARETHHIEAWYDWYAKDELPTGYWDQHLTRVHNPDEKTIASVADLPGDLPWGLEHLIVESLQVEHCLNLSMIRSANRLLPTFSSIGGVMGS